MMKRREVDLAADSSESTSDFGEDDRINYRAQIREAVSTCARPKSTSTSISANHKKRLESLLVEAEKAWCSDPNGVQKFACPLSHKYSQASSVSFRNLQGSDREVLSLLENAVDHVTNEKLFSVYLAVVTKHVTLEEERRNWYDGQDNFKIIGDVETEYETDNWVGRQGPINLGSLTVDFWTELLTAKEEYENDYEQEEEVNGLCEGIFGDTPDDEEEDSSCDTYQSTTKVQLWFRSAVLVFWPARQDHQIKQAVNADEANAAEANADEANAAKANADETNADEANAGEANGAKASADEADAAPTPMDPEPFCFYEKCDAILTSIFSNTRTTFSAQYLMSLTQDIQQVQTVLGLCTRFVLGEEDCIAVVSAVSQYGFPALAEDFLRLLSSQLLQTMVTLLNLVKPHCLAAEGQDEASTSPYSVSWRSLVQVLVNKVLQSSYFESDLYCANICVFAIMNCDDYPLVSIAKHLGENLELSSLNYLIRRLGEVAAGSSHACAVSSLAGIRCSVMS